MESVKTQYEKLPYPNLGFRGILGRPVSAAACALSYEFGQYLRTGRVFRHSKHTRILVAGCGTWEPIVVAHVHPHAQIVAVDFSKASLEKLNRNRLAQGISAKRLRAVEADLLALNAKELGSFDYIICTGVLHHSSQPAEMLTTLAGLLAPHGLLRLMIYAHYGRYWIQQTAKFLKASGITMGTTRLAEKIEAILPHAHPYRRAFETYADASTQSGLVDGFFHAYESPLSVLELGTLCEKLKLNLCGFGHPYHSQPHWVGRQLPALHRLDPWTRLETIDRLGELACNPVFWLCKELVDVRLLNPDTVTKEQLQLNPAFRTTFLPKTVSTPLFPDLDFSMTRSTWQRAAPASRFEAWLSSSVFLSDDGTLPRKLATERSRIGPRPNLKTPVKTTPPNESVYQKMGKSELHLRPSFQLGAVLQNIRAALRTLEKTDDAEIVHILGQKLQNPLIQSLQSKGLSAEEILKVVTHFPDLQSTLPQTAHLLEADARFWFY